MRPLILIALLTAPCWGYDSIDFREPIRTPETAKPVAVAASGDMVYVLDEKKATLFIYDASGKLALSAGRFERPKGLAIGPDGKLFVADAGASLVQILDARGKLISSFGNRGSEPGKLKDPESIAVGSDGRVYIADTGNDRVEIFTSDGILLTVLGSSGKGPGQFKGPTKVAVDPSGFVYVLDSGNKRLEKFDPSARFVRELRFRGDDFTVDPYGFIYALDPSAGKVYEENARGEVLGPFGTKGSGAGQYRRLAGVAVAPDGALLVLDAGNKRVDRVVISDKLETTPLPPDLAARLTASGPSLSWAEAASDLSAAGDKVYAALPKERKIVALSAEGKRVAGFDAPKKLGGMAADAKLGLFLADDDASRVQRFGPDGSWKENIGESSGLFDSKKKEGRVRDPRGLALNEQGTLYVADAGNRRVDAFNPNGMYLFGIGPALGGGELKEPVDVAWDKGRFVYFVDRALKKVFKCEPSGALLASWGSEGDGPGQFREPVSLALDGEGYLYVLDAGLRRVSVFTGDGRWMTDLFSGGLGPNELAAPAALAVQGRRLLIADPGKGRIVGFDLHPKPAPPSGVEVSSNEGAAIVTWRPVDEPWAAGYLVYRSTQPTGPFAVVGRTDAARFEDSDVAAYGKYYYKVAAEARTKDAGSPSAAVAVSIAGAFNRAPVEISTVSIRDVFSANYKWYLKNPLGTAVVTNNVNLPFEKVKLSFRLKDFMDFGYDTVFDKLAPKQSLEVPLVATLNNKILEVSEDTPIQAELTLTYFESGKKQTVSLTKPLRVYSRNAIRWDQPERIANFITPQDPPVLEFAREAIHSAPSNARAKPLNPNVVAAAQLWDALSEAGVRFFTNPANPYETVSADPAFPVDYTQFPRETLKRKSGQCDDLSTLMVSMLESIKVPAAVLDFPGHMALMFDTGASDPADAGLPDKDLVERDGTYWAPLEATMIGSAFTEAVDKAAYAYKTESAKGKARVIDVPQAWESFEPATLPPEDWRAEVPSPAARQKRFDEDASALFSQRDKFLRALYESRLKGDPNDADARVELGLLDVGGGDRAAAEREFSQAAKADPKNAAALNDLGAIAFLKGDYAGARDQYLRAVDADGGDADVWMNLVKTEVQLKDRELARQYGQKATALDPALSPSVETLLKGL